MIKLSDETLENLLTALAQATDEHGVPVHIPPEAAFTNVILGQSLSAYRYFVELPTHG